MISSAEDEARGKETNRGGKPSLPSSFLAEKLYGSSRLSAAEDSDKFIIFQRESLTRKRRRQRGRENGRSQYNRVNKAGGI